MPACFFPTSILKSAPWFLFTEATVLTVVGGVVPVVEEMQGTCHMHVAPGREAAEQELVLCRQNIQYIED